MERLVHNIRFYILILSGILSASIVIYVQQIISPPQIQLIRIEQYFAITAISFLYLTILIGPLFYTFPNLPFEKPINKARRAMGVSAAYFALLHAICAFFGQLHGFDGLRFLGIDFLVPVLLGFTALIILLLLAATSFDYAIEKIQFRNWKVLQRFVYLAGIFIIIHFLMLGTHFSDLQGIIPRITFVALALLLLLESHHVDDWLHRYIKIPKWGIISVVTTLLIVITYTILFNPFAPQKNDISFDIHAEHKQLAQLAVQQNQGQQYAVDISKLPGFDGDKNKRYTVSMTTNPPNPQPNQMVNIHFTVYDASSGNLITYFKYIYAKKIHMIIVNSSLNYFEHIHPDQDDTGFTITTQFPQADTYHIYIEFQPYGGIEQQMAFTIPVGNSPQSTPAPQSANPDVTTKTFGNYAVTMNTNGTLSAANMTFGNQKISFTVKDAKAKRPITTLKPYLATFGHLTMINEETYDFIHVHPYSLVVPPPDANGGPTVDFLPIGIYGPFKPGVYRVFAEFNPDNHLITSDFTVKINP